jgi:predicted HAD superfamily Cof-like phosphohydrolase
MKTMYDQVLEFHKVYNCVISKTPTLNVYSSDSDENKRLQILRLGLIQEEFNELKDAFNENDLIEVADACADILYVVLGLTISYGIPIDEVFAEVHRSNMSKLDENGNPVIREDGKVIKGKFYSPPDLAPILHKHGWKS